MTAKDILLVVIVPLALAEFGPWCGWLAARVLPLAAKLRYGDTERAAVRLEEWSGDLNDIPGQLTKLAYAFGQLAAGSVVSARRKTARGRAHSSQGALLEADEALGVLREANAALALWIVRRDKRRFYQSEPPREVIWQGDLAKELGRLVRLGMLDKVRPDDARRVYYYRTDSPLWEIMQAVGDAIEP